MLDKMTQTPSKRRDDAPWQYFSKLYLKWVDAKSTDCKESLKEYHYEIRETPKTWRT